MKPILQSETAECGLASLAMVAHAHGLHLGLAEMRRRFPLPLKGARLDQLIDVAQRLGFSSRALRLDMEDLGRLGLPCIRGNGDFCLFQPGIKLVNINVCQLD